MHVFDNGNYLNREIIQKLPKINIHEHLDCSLRPKTMLELWKKIGFEQCRIPFPPEILHQWQTCSNDLEFECVSQKYQLWLSQLAGSCKDNYLNAIVEHVLPIMQSTQNITRITDERVEDAVKDGIIALELRFAPQLFTREGLSIEESTNAVLKGIENTPIPVQLTLCVLRHEGPEMAQQIADLVIKSDNRISGFDLSGDESNYPGLLSWWLPYARRVQEAGKKVTIHLWETNEPKDEDASLLEEYNIKRISHGFRGNLQGDQILEIAPTSNVYLGNVSAFNQHPIHSLYLKGKRVTLNTDGTLFVNTDLTNEYLLMHQVFGWNKKDFLNVNLNAVTATSFSDEIRSQLRITLEHAYF